MRFHLASADRARSAAKTLRKNLFDHGIEASLGACQAAIAAALGYAGWAELKGQAGRHPPSPFDHEIGGEPRAERQARQVAALAKAFALDPGTADALVRTLALTASRLTEGQQPAGGSPTVADFLAGCSAKVLRHDGGTTVLAVMGWGADCAFRYEALFEGDAPFPSLTFGSWPMAPAPARDPAPRLTPSRLVADHIWNGGFQVLGFGPGPEERLSLSGALLKSKGAPATEAEVDQAVAGWRRLLREAGVRGLDARVDRGALALFDHASSPPPNACEAYEDLRDAPGNARLRSLLSAFPMLAHEIWRDPAIRGAHGPADAEALVDHLAAAGLSCGASGQTGPLPRKLVESFRGETGGGAPWTHAGAMATLRLARARGEHSWRWWAGERLKAYVTLATTFRLLQALWDEGPLLEAIGRDRLDALLDGPPWRPVEACQAVLDQPDPDRLPEEVSTALARAAILSSGHHPPTGRPRLDPAKHGAALLDFLDAGTLDEALSRALMVIARASLGRRVGGAAAEA